MDNNTQSETFWIVRKWFQDDDEVENLVQSGSNYGKFWTLEDAERAQFEEFMDGYDKGETGKIFEVKTTYVWKEVE